MMMHDVTLATNGGGRASAPPPLFAIVAAAGEGQRLGCLDGEGKAGVLVCGKPLVVWSLTAVERAPGLAGGVLVVRQGDLERAREWLARALSAPGKWRLTVGGATRDASVYAGLREAPAESKLVLVHDAARPLLAEADLRAVVDAAERDGAAILASPVADSLKRVKEQRMIADVEREGLWCAETPQVVRRDWLLEAYRSGGAEATDEAGRLAALGRPVTVVKSHLPNLKVTRECDLQIAEGYLRGSA